MRDKGSIAITTATAVTIGLAILAGLSGWIQNVSNKADASASATATMQGQLTQVQSNVTQVQGNVDQMQTKMAQVQTDVSWIKSALRAQGFKAPQGN